MKDNICLKDDMNEYKYSEDTQMALKDALYANEFSFDCVKKLAVNGSMTLIFVPWLSVASPNNRVFAECLIPQIELREFQFDADEFEKIDNPVIEGSEVAVASPYDAALTFLKNLKTLPTNYQAIDFEIPSEAILENAQKFLVTMRDAGLECPDEGCVMPSAFGTIVVDLMVRRGLISIEIGRTKVGFFTDYEDGINEESDGILTDFSSIPKPLLKHLVA